MEKVAGVYNAIIFGVDSSSSSDIDKSINNFLA